MFPLQFAYDIDLRVPMLTHLRTSTGTSDWPSQTTRIKCGVTLSLVFIPLLVLITIN